MQYKVLMSHDGIKAGTIRNLPANNPLVKRMVTKGYYEPVESAKPAKGIKSQSKAKTPSKSKKSAKNDKA